MVYQLVYSSRAQSGIDESTIADVAWQSINRNIQRDVSGILLFAGGHILQVLEGDYEEVQSLYMAIARDPRHADVTVLAQHEASSRAFGDRPMEFKSIQSAQSRALMTALTTQLQMAAFAFPSDERVAAHG